MAGARKAAAAAAAAAAAKIPDGCSSIPAVLQSLVVM
jgi:hypothetical protein